jgi:hypothetical protein
MTSPLMARHVVIVYEGVENMCYVVATPGAIYSNRFGPPSTD